MEKRNASIELLKLVSLFLIVVSHVVQTLIEYNPHVTSNEYVLPVSYPITNFVTFFIVALRYLGIFGNATFFICSAYFLVDKETINFKKILIIFIDVWIISIIFLTSYLIYYGWSNIDSHLILRSFFPTFFENNWYITIYLLLSIISPLLNIIIKSISRPALFWLTLALFVIYIVVAMFVKPPYYSVLIVWITLYFVIGYLKKYSTNLLNSNIFSVCLILIGLIGHITILVITNELAKHMDIGSVNLLSWFIDGNLFITLLAFGIFNLIRKIEFNNRFITYISSLSLFVYVIHENILFRTYTRPLIWNWIHTTYGYDYVLLLILLFSLSLFVASIIISIIYKESIHRLVSLLGKKLYQLLSKFISFINKKILKTDIDK